MQTQTAFFFTCDSHVCIVMRIYSLLPGYQANAYTLEMLIIQCFFEDQSLKLAEPRFLTLDP